MKIYCWMILAVKAHVLGDWLIKNSELSSLFLVYRRLSTTTLWFCLALSLSACQPANHITQITYTGPIMGTEYRVTVVADKNKDFELIEAQIVSAMDLINQSMSTYLDDSEVSKFNRVAAGKVFKTSPELAEVINEALTISRLTDGAFDITVAGAVNLWGFGPDGTITEKPDNAELEALKASSGYQHLVLDDQNLSKLVDGLTIDLSAIAKGYTVDKVAEVLFAHGIHRFLINIGGELRASGTSANGQLWRVGIEKPHVLGGVQRIAMLDNLAIATSGDYRNYRVIDGQQFSHAIDTETLAPSFHQLALVSVLAERTSTADALATAMLVMGEERALEFARRHDIPAYFVVREPDAGIYNVLMTEKFKSVLQ